MKEAQEPTIQLFGEVKTLLHNARNYVVQQVNLAMVHTYYQIGYLIVEHQQEGKERAKYAAETLKFLSKELTKEFGKGFSVDNLQNMRLFFLTYQNRISETLSRKSDEKEKYETVFRISEENEKSQTLSGISNQNQKYESLIRKSEDVETTLLEIKEFRKYETLSRIFQSVDFKLTWSHYLFLIHINNTAERDFYEIEASQNRWSVRELKRQFNSSLYERLALSRDKDKVRELSQKGQIIEQPHDIIKEPLILEFLGLSEKAEYSESKLENAIIKRLQDFMLELGKGFLFEARQKRISFDDKHFHIDLSFYNRILRCFVLIDLKIGELTHQDIGQMQMYVNYYDRFVKEADENPTIGIILCKKKSEMLMEITLPADNTQIFASKYQTVLPSKEDFSKLIF